ncbi:hypothetical protein HanRHA438_Chr14g0674451 [Helianthus annuus]|nr:hypothetical protein HanRHA438_Chr14g0674451 [Helianthus annuus]
MEILSNFEVINLYQQIFANSATPDYIPITDLNTKRCYWLRRQLKLIHQDIIYEIVCRTTIN